MSVDEDRLNQLLERVISDFGGAWHAPLVVIGDRLGLYRALAEHGPLDSAQLAARTQTHERYVREWLRAQAAGGYVSYDPQTERYHMSPEQSMVLVNEDSPTFLVGAFQGAIAGLLSTPKIEAIFRSGEGFGWDQHDPSLFHATERLFRPGYTEHLVRDWIPALDGIADRLANGARVADIGCGFGASTILMAQAFPASSFTGFDYHENSVRIATERAQAAGMQDRVRFEVASAKGYRGNDYDLVAAFDCLHDMGDPVGVASHVLETLGPEGSWMIVEPFANDRVEDNFNPVGRAFYSVSTMVCTPCSLAQEVGLGLGAQAGEAHLREVVSQGGFNRFRRAAQTPFNLVFEARP
ncbi:MAG TPA: methyltransferase domain-containing protein [Nitrococcus sp.]|nr:methyltransferase domain-containing protein [Nitrococcus sp.]